MLITIGEFRQRVTSDCAELVSQLQDLTGRYGSDEAAAWRSSLPKLSRAFQAESFQPLHLYFGSRGNLALEYQLPASSSWCDVVLLGSHQQHPSAVILELKDWMTRNDRPWKYPGLMERQGAPELHPSDQVRGYVEYCRRFHSAVSKHRAAVHGCVLFTRDRWIQAYSEPPNDGLAAEYPLFSVESEDVRGRLPEYFESRLTSVDEAFAHAFAEGRYRQDRGFVAQIGAQILDPKSDMFELLDNQRKAMALCRATIAQTFQNPDSAPPKKVVIVRGPPGSGKSVIAARLWASLVTDPSLPDGDVVFTTTSRSQNSNWGDLFKRAARIPGASGVLRKATSYSPATPKDIGQLRKKYGGELFAGVDEWREHLDTLRSLGFPFRDGARDNQNLVSVVDEAHALINPEREAAQGQFGFPTNLGPQAYHIIRSSLLTVLLLDPLQGFRQRENTSIDDLRHWSRELGAGDPVEVSLDGMQFRCAGSAEYVAWVESVLSGSNLEETRALAKAWRGDERPRLDFRIFDDPEDWEAELRERHESGASVRLLASYARPWKTADTAKPHALPPALMDFHEPYVCDGKKKYWSRIWNYVPGNGTNYTWFVTGHPAGHIAKNPLCEVGCPYAVRGFDYDYVGILWLNDLRYRNGRMEVDPHAVEETGIRDLYLKARREERPGPATAALLERVCQAYRILFTRALKGVYAWVPDDETLAYLQACVSPKLDSNDPSHAANSR